MCWLNVSPWCGIKSTWDDEATSIFSLFGISPPTRRVVVVGYARKNAIVSSFLTLIHDKLECWISSVVFGAASSPGPQQRADWSSLKGFSGIVLLCYSRDALLESCSFVKAAKRKSSRIQCRWRTSSRSQ